MVYSGSHAMNKSIITNTIATKGMILERSESILTHVFAPSREKSNLVEVDEYLSVPLIIIICLRLLWSM